MKLKGISFVGMIVLVLALGQMTSGETIEGIENYNKKQLVEEYGSDLNSGLFLFPADAQLMIEPSFISRLKSDLFDTQGYLVLQTKYHSIDYEKEVERLENTSCMVQGQELAVQSDTESYALPAYVAMDGFDYVYEYALIDDKTCEITYLWISNPDSMVDTEYEKCLKKRFFKI